jgi:hypothetical protein
MAGSSKRSHTCDESTANNVESLSRPISPPRKRLKEAPAILSPWQLTWIRDLPEELNRDAVTLKDLLGDPLIAECWEFNYLHDIRFLMDAFDLDTRHLVKVHVVHGFWKQDDVKRRILMVSDTRANHSPGSRRPPLFVAGTIYADFVSCSCCAKNLHFVARCGGI